MSALSLDSGACGGGHSAEPERCQAIVLGMRSDRGCWLPTSAFPRGARPGHAWNCRSHRYAWYYSAGRTRL